MDAVLCGSTDDIFRCLQNSQSLIGGNLRGQSALHLAAALRTAALPVLFECGVEVDVQDNRGRTPLGYVAAYGTAQSVILYLKRSVKDHEDDLKHIPFFT